MRQIKLAIVIILILFTCMVIDDAYIYLQHQGVFDYLRFLWPTAQVGWADLPQATSLERCTDAPFVVPTDGWIGVIYGDSILGTVNHSGLDIFGLEENGVTPVYVAYDGFLTRLPNWKSAVVIRHPEDPIKPSRQIWSYYAHMADEEGNSYIVEQIPPGTYELPVKQGMLLGYQGDYNGGAWRSVSTHLHFSIILSDEKGKFLNETDILNTLDPSPYFGMRLNSQCADRPPACRQDFLCTGSLGFSGGYDRQSKSSRIVTRRTSFEPKEVSFRR
ncbi:M23 family metallopeptidase [Anaerolineales bacterium HSG25]|nr:M23 family metallopeptidase [Anaerolineales bacterium HSG25]